MAIFAVLACCALLSGTVARACTDFCYSQGNTVLAGRSLDTSYNRNLGMLLVPATASTHGWVSCGPYDYPWADGMNDQGLFVGSADVPATYTSRSSRQPADHQRFLSALLANCATVNEAIKWCRKQPTPSLDGWVHQSAPGNFTFVTVGHLLVADRSGDSVIFEWPKGKLKTSRKRGRYQLMTNFLLTDPKAGDYPCARYFVDSRIFDKAAGPALQTCQQVLETTSLGRTRYSLLYDLPHGDVHVYLRRRFDQPKTIHLADELQKGRHEFDLDQWFGRPEPEPLAPPPVIAKSTVSAKEILQRSLAARGGEKAATRIRSIHMKGAANLDMACLSPSPAEYFAMRPNRYRAVLGVIVPDGPNLGQYVNGFDGHTGWNSGPDGSCQILEGQDYDLRKDAASFFGWYDLPGDYESAECLGEAKFDGELCYEVKEVSKTHNEYFEYYDTSNFLLAGSFFRVPGGSSWVKTTFSDYRPFHDFLIPTRIAWQDDADCHSAQFDSVEINSVEERDLRMDRKTALAGH